MRSMMLALAGAALIAACSGDQGDTAVADSLNRDLQMAPVDSSQALNDAPVEETPSAGATTPATPANPRPATPRPSTPRSEPAAPAPSSGGALASGTTFSAETGTAISSNTHEVGQTITARVSENVRDSRGRIVIPAGSDVTLTITAIRESENKSDNTGTLTLAATSVSINGTSYGLDGGVSGIQTTLADRGTNVGDVAKVGAGAAAGAVVGRVLGGGSKGAVIGGVIGGAVGAQRANETQDRDVVLAEGSSVTITLNDEFSRS